MAITAQEIATDSLPIDRVTFLEECHLRGYSLKDAAEWMGIDRTWLGRQLDKGKLTPMFSTRVHRFLAEVRPLYQRVNPSPEQQLQADLEESPSYAVALFAAIAAASGALGVKLDNLTIEQVKALIAIAK